MCPAQDEDNNLVVFILAITICLFVLLFMTPAGPHARPDVWQVHAAALHHPANIQPPNTAPSEFNHNHLISFIAHQTSLLPPPTLYTTPNPPLPICSCTSHWLCPSRSSSRKSSICRCISRRVLSGRRGGGIEV